MTKAAETVLADALRLDVKARAELAAELLASLDGHADPDALAWGKKSSACETSIGPRRLTLQFNVLKVTNEKPWKEGSISLSTSGQLEGGCYFRRVAR